MSQHRISNPPILSSSRAGWNSIVAEKYCLPASEAHELSQHCSISIVLGHSFELDWRLDGGRLHKTQMCKGDISITPNGLLAQGRWNKTIECLVLSLNPTLIERAASESANTGNIEIVPQRGVRDPQIYYIGQALLAELEAGGLAGCLYGESLSLALAVHLIKRYSTSNQPIQEPVRGLSWRKLQQVTDYINDNLTQNLTLSEMADFLEMSPYYFARLFKQTTGLAPHQYVINCRIERAKILLAENKLPLVEIGYRVGCSSQSNFTALFRKHVGITPKAYREQTKK
ncbi:MAG TPA: AraC family transcriptional regulator [Coleofasciculaceae cyanobacterium]|jgi:AraC family transcriptional regulator